MKKIGIFFGGKDNGSTMQVAEKIKAQFGDQADIYNVAKSTKEDIEKYDNLILGTAAMGIGEMNKDWERFIETLVSVDLKAKKIALFGLGDQKLYPESFVDGMGTIYLRMPHKENIVGFTSTKGYTYYYSTAEIDEQFVGLAIDNDSQKDATEKRIADWVSTLKEIFI